MRSLLYILVKRIAQLAFFLYYKRITLFHTDRIPNKGPILFLPNHQNALMDPLIMAGYAKRKPYFLTRSDVFANRVLRAFFGFLQMMPIYRLQDGRSKLSNNEAIFETCSDLLLQEKSLVIFPEGNHNIQRRVRPLSKGFTRFLFRSMERDPEFNPALIPVGVNYKDPAGFPDSATFYFGDPIYFQDVLAEDKRETIERSKEAIYAQLIQLTTHIADEDHYEEIISRLDGIGVDYLAPKTVNARIGEWQKLPKQPGKKVPVAKKAWDVLFTVLNLPLILIWRMGIRRLVPEIEFMTTFRFLYAVLAYPVFYGLTYVLLVSYFSWQISFAILAGHILHNFLYVKWR